MKFSNGYWLKKEGVTIYYPREIQDIKIMEHAVELYISSVFVGNNRGATLAGPLLTVTLKSPQPDIISVDITHFKGICDNKPRFDINDINYPLDVKHTEELLEVKSGNMTVEISLKNTFEMRYLYKSRYLTSTGDKKMGLASTPTGSYVIEQLDLSVGEKIYGLGERFGNYVKNGQSIDIWNEDGGTASQQAYKNVSFYLSSQNYGVFVDHTEKVSYEIGSEVVSRVQFSVPGESLRYLVIPGDSRKDVIRAYTSLLGLPALPPAWSFGLWLTTSFTTNYDENTVSSFVNGMAERNIPLHVFHYDCFWMKKYEWCSFEWDENMFPDVEDMLTRLKSKGLKLCVWINPYVGQKSPMFEEGAKSGYFIKRTNNDVWQWDMWQPGLAIVDFTNPDACKWYKEKLRILIRQGIDCFKTDFGERIPTEDVKYFNGADPIAMHNYYTYLFNKLVFDLLLEERGTNEAVLFARSAAAGSQKFPVHWSGDCDSTYPAMAECLRGGLSLCLSGFGFWSHDISGFEATATPDLYKRWTAFGLLSTHSRLHGSHSYRVPWLFDGESVDVLRYFTNLKCRLMPYLYTMAVETSKTGVPEMRAMILEFEDRACLELDTQYMLGDRILVAPIFNEDSTSSYYLPKGTWTHLLSEEEVEGGSWRNEKYDYFSLPLFVRENTLLPIGENDQQADYDYSEGLELKLYALKDGAEAKTKVCDSSGTEFLRAKAVRSKNKVKINLDGKITRIVLVGISNIEDLTGAAADKEDSSVVLTNIQNKVEFSLKEN